ncbi:MAG TPA: right-handed parallel beta-helix repeat-containing protein [Thermoanaerobaculia bacterium]|nr:right-handed parallel beta-helix repeat-containing protein [Thermoanaerobaculia bacterium]
MHRLPGDPSTPCDPQLWDTCHSSCRDPNDQTRFVNMALYGAAKFALRSFADGSMEMGPLSHHETVQMFQQLGITSSNGVPNEHALNDLSAYLAFADPRRYQVRGGLLTQGMPFTANSMELCSEYLPSAVTNAFGVDPIDPTIITYVLHNLPPGEHTLAVKPGGFAPPVRSVMFTFNATSIPGKVCSTDIAPIDFTMTTGVYCDNANGDDANSGRSWRTSKKSIRAAMDASREGEEIWVAAGKYVENIALKPGVKLYGGFAGVEIFREERNPERNRTILDGKQKGSVISIPSRAGRDTVVDGFTIQHGNAAWVGGGIQIACGAAPTIANNSITDNRADFAGGGIGMTCDGASESGNPIITNNRIADNRAGIRGGGIYAAGRAVTILNNSIGGNRAEFGGGIHAADGLIANNALVENRADASGGGIYGGHGSAQIINNALVDNRADQEGGGIALAEASALVASNIIAFGSSGIAAARSSISPNLRNNCVFGNREFDYLGVPRGTGDLNVDPRLNDLRGKEVDVRLRPTSPCIDAGDDAAVGPGWTDINGDPRILRRHVDIGADEAHNAVAQRSAPLVMRAISAR